MSNKVGITVCVVSCGLVLIGLAVLEAWTPDEPPQAVYRVDILPDTDVLPSEINGSLVKVHCYFGGDRWYGNGIIMQRGDRTFVLTSEMIFTGGVGSIVVTFLDGSTSKSEIITTNSDFGLTALKIDGRLGMELDDAPNLPPDATTTVFTIDTSGDAQVVGYLNQDWMLITGVNESYVGAPLVNGGEVSGLVIGMNRANMTQAIAVGNRALNEFADSLDEPSTPPGGRG